MVPMWTAGSLVTIPMPAGTVWWRPLMKTSRCACTWYWRLSAVSGTSPAAVASSTTRSGGGAGQSGARVEADGSGRSPEAAVAGVRAEISATTTSPITTQPVSAFCTLNLSITRDVSPGSRASFLGAVGDRSAQRYVARIAVEARAHLVRHVAVTDAGFRVGVAHRAACPRCSERAGMTEGELLVRLHEPQRELRRSAQA